ncbi:MAG: type II toxin-antitoxin system VapC family toxin [Promethearchaeota archaeon]|nr:MAG: type II toxin-antitoxin system VapC family toxin [Candidatus Lokiarchaeota archaeon]
MGIVLDTDFCIGILNGMIPKQVFLDQFGRRKIYITSSSIFELHRGLFKQFYGKNAISKERFEQEQTILGDFISSFIELPYDGKSALLTAQIFERLRSKGADIGLYDCQIAGTILAHNLHEILTLNIRHFERITDLKILQFPNEADEVGE